MYIYVILNLCMVWVICESKSTRNSTKLTRVLDIIEEKRPTNNIQCEQLPLLVLADLLGEAYNARYMSINWPVTSDDNIFSKNGASDKDVYSYSKRKVESIPSFYVEESLAVEISDKPAWEVNHAQELESNVKRRKRRSKAVEEILKPVENHDVDQQFSIESASTQTEQNGDQPEETLSRTKRAYGRGSNADNAKKLYPWKCEASIKWVDMGPDYFPRYLRTVECTRHYCWYKVFVCKPKSFAVKILHRQKGMCANAANLKKISAFDFRGEYGELWKWEEVAINFCCDCAIA